jgi:integrase
MSDMPKPRPPHLRHETTRHGATVWYVRIDDGARIRIWADYGTARFWSEYHAAVAGSPLPKAGERRVTGKDTVGWLIARYKESAVWAILAPATRRQRENVLLKVIESAGSDPIEALTKAAIIKGRDRRRATPEAANHLIKTLRALFHWAIDADLVSVDPTAGVKLIRTKSEGHATWTAADIAAYRARWPIGTRERLAFDVLYFTGLRRGDAVRLGRQHVRDGVATIVAEKTAKVLNIPIMPELADSIAASLTGDMAFICGADGNPVPKASFGNWFRKAVDAAGIKGKSAHGLRKADATETAESGATDRELMARFGWSDARQAATYTRQTDQKRMAIEAARKRQLEHETNNGPPHLDKGAAEKPKTKARSKG